MHTNWLTLASISKQTGKLKVFELKRGSLHSTDVFHKSLRTFKLILLIMSLQSIKIYISTFKTPNSKFHNNEGKKMSRLRRKNNEGEEQRLVAYLRLEEV